MKYQFDRTNFKSDHGRLTLDTNAILTNQNLNSFIAELEQQNLLQKQTYEEIPVFIKFFLDQLQYEGKFLIANPGETWQYGCSQPEPLEIDSSTLQLSIINLKLYPQFRIFMSQRQ